MFDRVPVSSYIDCMQWSRCWFVWKDKLHLTGTIIDITESKPKSELPSELGVMRQQIGIHHWICMHRLPHLRIEIASVAGEMCISGQQTCRQLHTSTLVAHYAAATVVLIIYAIIHCSEANITTHSSSDAGNTSSLLNHSIVQGMFDKLKMNCIAFTKLTNPVLQLNVRGFWGIRCQRVKQWICYRNIFLVSLWNFHKI